MSDQVQAYHQTCNCGHDRSSHHEEIVALFEARANEKPGDKRRAACLCRGCDCAQYREVAL